MNSLQTKPAAKHYGGTSEMRMYTWDDHEITGKVRLCLDFETPQEMIKWLKDNRGEALPSDCITYFEHHPGSVVADIKDTNVFAVCKRGDVEKERRPLIRTIHERYLESLK